MRTSSLTAGVSRFAQFSGLTRGGRRAAAEDRDDDSKGARRARAEEDEEDKEDKSSKRSRAADDDDQKEDKSSKRSRAEEDDDDKEDKSSKRSRASDDDDECEDEDEKKDSKRSRRARAEDDEDDDDDKDEMTGRSAAANARRRERARCAAIFEHPAAADNVALAASLAFETSMTRREAVAVLKGQAGRGPTAHDVRGERDDRRSRNNPDLGVGGGDAPKGASLAAGLWDRAIKSVGVTPRK